jgi:hypothetical protein
MESNKGQLYILIMALISTAVGLFWIKDYMYLGHIRLKEGTPIYGWQALVCMSLWWIFCLGIWFTWWRKKLSQKKTT